jgi:hypothetical protein
MKKMTGVGLLLALGFLVGCNKCGKLTDSLCQDLGPADCAAWKALGGPEQILHVGRGMNQACGVMMSDKKAYQGLLQSARGTVMADQLKKALAAKDYAKAQEIRQKLESLGK